MLSIIKTKACMIAIGDLSVDAIDLVKSGISIGSISKVFKIFASARILVESAPDSIKELSDLNQQEISELAGLSFSLVTRIIEAVKKK
jgi:hypothetical protein